MKNVLVFMLCLMPLGSGIFAQHPLRRSIPAPQIYRPHEIRHEDSRRMELSKKLTERKNELRKEDRGGNM